MKPASTAEIDLVQIEFEDLVLREFPFERERQDHFAQLARPGIAVRQEDIARQLLGDRRCALHPAPGAIMFDREDRGARHPDRIDAGMIAKAPILDRNHRILHHLRRFAQRQPAPVIGPERQEYGTVGGMDADRLAGRRLLQFLEARDALRRNADRDRDRDDADQRKREAPAEQTAEPEAQARRPPGAGALARAFA